MNIEEAEEGYVMSTTGPLSPLIEPIQNPFQDVIGLAHPLFTGRVTRSRSSANPLFQNPNSDFQEEDDSALRTTADVPPTTPAPLVQNLRARQRDSFSPYLEPQTAETRFSLSDVASLLNMISQTSGRPTPSVPQPTSTFAFPSEANTIPTPIQAVPRSEYSDISSTQSKHFSALPKFSNSGKDNRDNMKTFMVALSECDLLCKSERLMPIVTTRNPGGYSARTLIFNDDGYTIIQADDIFKWDFDIKKLLVILNMVTGKDLHYLLKRIITDNDAVLWFKTIYNHINGTKNTDIRKATDALNGLKIKASQTIQENTSIIEEAFRVLTVASGIPISEDQKLYHLQEKLEHDTRVSVLSTMANFKTSKASYNDTVEGLILLDPTPTVAHKMASLTQSTELCRRHIAGLCTNGSSCKYSHAKAPSSKGIPSDKKTSTTPSAPGKKIDKPAAKFPFKKPIIISESHRALVGYPKGVASAKNPSGYSLNQLTAIKTLQLADVDGWTSGDPNYFHGEGSNEHINRFNMVRFETQQPGMIALIPQNYDHESSPIKAPYSCMSTISREEQLSETTDHTPNRGYVDSDDEDEISDDKSSDDEDDEEKPEDTEVTPPKSSSAHHRRCNESLALQNPFVMGNKRSLFASIQRDTKQPSRKRLPKPESFEAYDESHGTSSSRMLLPSRSETRKPITLQDPPALVVETHETTIEHPPMLDEQSLKMSADDQDMSQPVVDLLSPPINDMLTPPKKSPTRVSLSALRRAKTKALEGKKMNLLTVHDTKMMSLKKTNHKTVIDSGASTSGTGQRDTLRDLRPTSCSVSAAFGESAQPTEMGLLPPFMLKTIVIEDMKDTTLLSVSQTCAKGFVGIFTSKDCKFFNAIDVIPHLKELSLTAQPVMSGKVEDGLYLLNSK